MLRECEHGEEQLSFCENMVTHSVSDGKCGTKLIRNFTLQSTVVQAVWCTFHDRDENKSLEAICAIDSSRLEIFSDEGDNFPTGLPFHVRPT